MSESHTHFEINMKYIIWFLLYIGYVVAYLLFLTSYNGSIADFELSFFVGLLPMLLLVMSIAAESLLPYNVAWKKVDLDSINNVLFMVINNYSDAWGKALAVIVVLKLKSLPAFSGVSAYWPDSLLFPVQVLLGLLLYDFVYYWYHRISHQVGFLWRLHRLHHSSTRLTTLAVFKFNILDIFIELFLLTVVVKTAGIPDKVFLVMAGFMVPATLLSHANFSAYVPDWLGWMVINPDNHRIHHANDSKNYNKNFGGFTLLWDVVFGTYQPVSGVVVKQVGVEGHLPSKWFGGQFFDFLKP